MFRDQKKELDRLEKALLEQTEPEEEFEEDPEEISEEEIPEYTIYNNDATDVDPEEFSEEIDDPPKKRSMGLLAVAFFLMTGAFCFLIWFILKSGGFLG